MVFKFLLVRLNDILRKLIDAIINSIFIIQFLRLKRHKHRKTRTAEICYPLKFLDSNWQHGIKPLSLFSETALKLYGF